MSEGDLAALPGRRVERQQASGGLPQPADDGITRLGLRPVGRLRSGVGEGKGVEDFTRRPPRRCGRCECNPRVAVSRQR